MHTDIEGHAHQNHAEQKRAAPAPCHELLVREPPRQERHHAGGEAQARGKAHLRNTGVEGAFALARVFISHEHRAAPFAAEPEALAEAQGLEDDRRGNADLGVGRDKADADGRQPHDEHGQHQHALTSELVAEVAENEPAEGTGQIADGKGTVGQNGAYERVGGGEEQLVEDDARHNPVQKEVVPFDGGSEQTGKDDLADLLLAGCAHAMLLGTAFRRPGCPSARSVAPGEGFAGRGHLVGSAVRLLKI